MSDLEAVELQLLEIVIPAGSEGRNYGLPNLYNELARGNSHLSKIAMNLAYELIIAALIDLLEQDCVRIRHYIGSESLRRQGSESIETFYRGTFTCTRLFPAAFKRRDALVGKSRRGIFISHNVPEAKLPIALKEFLRLALGPDYPVFVSSDFETIQGGKPWFAEIVKAVQTASAVLVLVTAESMNQRWLNFEAGIGVGSGIPVMPLLARGSTKSNFVAPLNQLQAREIANRDDFNGMIKDFQEVFGCCWSPESIDTLFADLQRISGELDAVNP